MNPQATAPGNGSTQGNRAMVPISPRIVFFTLGIVRSVRGCDAETVLNSVGDATHPHFLRWVFNVAVKPGGRHDLRFWKNEIWGSAGKWAEPGNVIAQILGGRQSFPRGEIEVQWVLTSTTLSRLIRAKELAEENGELPRASLAAFLERRLQ